MKTINETFTEDEFKMLKEAKEQSGAKSWHDYVVL
jgi:hypothetical protein